MTFLLNQGKTFDIDINKISLRLYRRTFFGGWEYFFVLFLLLSYTLKDALSTQTYIIESIPKSIKRKRIIFLNQKYQKKIYGRIKHDLK